MKIEHTMLLSFVERGQQRKIMQIIPCHKKMYFHEEYVLQRWDLTQQQMLSVQKQVYTPGHAVQSK